MSVANDKRKYREWIRSRHGSIYKEEVEEKSKVKNWRINRTHIRETIIDEYSNGIQPRYMITRSYHYDQQDRSLVEEHNDRINMVLDDFFNPRGMPDRWIQKDHFIERHKDKLVRKEEVQVKNTILDEMEFDWRMEIKKGGFHVHSLISDPPDDAVWCPSSRVQKAIERVYGMDEIPISLRNDEGLVMVKKELIERALRDRCDFMSTSHMSIDIHPSDEYGSFDGYRGWKGQVAYVTKNMYNVDNIVEIYDSKNSTVLDINNG
jgi:hypothetical protein